MTRLPARAGLLALFVIVGLVAAAPAGAANFTVNSTADTHDANLADPACATAAGTCTLRAAVDQANLTPAPDVIVLRGGTYTLTGAAGNNDNSSGDLDIRHATTISGAGARRTKIVGTGSDRVIDLEVEPGALLKISGVTITGGGGQASGGGIHQSNGFLMLSDSSVVRNRVESPTGTSNQGGGLFVSAHFHLENVTIAKNVATRGASSSFGPQGGGLYDNGATLPASIENVTFAGNRANGAGAQGGGEFDNATDGAEGWTNVTMTGNSVSGSGAQAGGIFVNDHITIRNSIVARNRSGSAKSNCFLNDSVHSVGNNLEEGTDCAFTLAGDLRNTNPLLAPLANYGGQVDTQALLSGSPAIDSGTAEGCPKTDARGVARPQGPECDIGAFEAGCLTTRGKLHGKSLGGAKLGRSQKAQRRKFQGLRLKTRKGLDRYCAAGGGSFQVGYPTKRLLRTLKRNVRRKLKKRVVIVVTSSKHFSLKGLRRGDSRKKARRRLPGARRLRVGNKRWLVVPGRRVTLLVRIHAGKVQEIGIADGRLSNGTKGTKRLLRAWRIS